MNDLKFIRIYVVSHSEEDIKKIRNDEIYTPLFVGRNGKDNLGFCSDDNFEGNISDKNKDYCELTGLYWMWKMSNSDIIGLCHYRRYFKGKNGKFIEKEEILNYLTSYDIILPKKSALIKGTYWETYKEHYISDALKITRRIISKNSKEYLETFDNVLNQSSFYNYNMFIAPKEIINEYCIWIFPILKDLEEEIDLENSPRILGLVAEAIFNVWIEHSNLKIKETPICYLGNELKFRMFLINNKLFRKIYQILYFKFLKTNKGKIIEKKIHDLFY
ncbi:MAG: DUF4422 domain-containing protein [archaeon]|nr:DUF4422 domain-containing protein [archaeon]